MGADVARSLLVQKADYEEILIPPTEEEWLELRRPHWNASLAGCLFPDSQTKTGCRHPYISLGDACTEKLRPDFEVLDEDRLRLFRRGLKMEPYIAAEAAELTGLVMQKPTHMVRRGPMLMTPDYYGRSRSSEERVVVECKSTIKYLGPVCPAYWRAQVLGQIWCDDAERGLIAALGPTLEVVIYEIYRDDDEIEWMIHRAQHIINCLALNEIPDGVKLSAGNVSQLWPKDTGEAVDLPPGQLKVLKKYLDARALEKKAKAEKEDARDEIVALLGRDSSGLLAGNEVATYRASKDVDKTDWKALAAKYPKIVAEFTKTVPGSRRFNFKERGYEAALNMIGGVDDDADIDW